MAHSFVSIWQTWHLKHSGARFKTSKKAEAERGSTAEKENMLEKTQNLNLKIEEVQKTRNYPKNEVISNRTMDVKKKCAELNFLSMSRTCRGVLAFTISQKL